MGETVEKIHCCDRDNNDNALAAAILANGNNRRDDWGPMAAMMGGGMNNWMNNPFAYLMFLALFRNGGFGFGDGHGAGIATQGIETQAQLNALSALSCRTTKMPTALSPPSRAMVLLLASLRRLSISTSTLFRSAASKAQNIIDKAPSLLADLYPDPLKDEASCLRAAYKVANDPDGYEGMIFCRWTADAIGKAISINWKKFI